MPESSTPTQPGRARIAVVIVTHNSARFMEQNLRCLAGQTLPPAKIAIVDSASKETGYLAQLAERHPAIELMLCKENVGFCKGNNLGAARVIDNSEYIVFLNPDAYLSPAFLQQALEFMERPENRRAAVVSGTLLGFDNAAGKPTGRIDSTGIFCTWYGRWYDRGQGAPAEPLPAGPSSEAVPAICGALMFCRAQALRSILMRRDEVFDERYYMYKEDIDLSLRLRRARWTLHYLPALQAYHCRGWQPKRAKMNAAARLRSAENELRLCVNHPSHHILYALAKFLYVHGLEARQTGE